MFEIRCVVKDAKLAEALRSLDGLCYNLNVVPVKTEEEIAPVDTEKAVRKPRVGPSLTDIMMLKLNEQGVRIVTPAIARQIAIDAGYHVSSYVNALKRLVVLGKLRETDEGYEVVNG